MRYILPNQEFDFQSANYTIQDALLLLCPVEVSFASKIKLSL